MTDAPPRTAQLMNFSLLKPATSTGAARLGRLAIPRLGGAAIDTPTYLASTSRGAVPHLTPDVVARHTAFPGAYLAYEEFLDQARSERAPAQRAPSSAPGASSTTTATTRLHEFASLPRDRMTVLGTRRAPPLAAPRAVGSGGKTASTVCTSTGFRPLENATFARAVVDLRPDVVVPMTDLPPSFASSSSAADAATATAPSAKRTERMVDRTGDWTEQLLATLGVSTPRGQQATHAHASPAVFAPILPLPVAVQWDWLSRLSEDLLDAGPGVSGLAVHDASLLPDLAADYPALAQLPRLSLDLPRGPHEVLRQVALGVDLFLLPFVAAASDAGVALGFAFPPSPPSTSTATTSVLPLGIDMHGEEHATSLAPLVEGCTCYACRNHHRAYLRHLLAAREMLAWTLLQVHNHAVAERFLAGVRAVLASGEDGGAERFEELRDAFAARYEPEIPPGSGTRPRARGYHFKTEPGTDRPPTKRINPPAWQNMGDAATEEPGVEMEEAATAEQAEGLVEELAGGGVLEKEDGATSAKM